MRTKLGRSNIDYHLLKDEARSLRTAGESYPEIARILSVSKSTISHWCRDIELTEQQIAALGARYDKQYKGAKANQLKRQLEVQDIQQEARKEIKKPSREAFRMAGAMLYWGEGSKGSQVVITNSDPNLVLFMIRWLKEFFDIPPQSLKAHLTLHANQDELEIKKYWSNLTNIPLDRFIKSYIKPEKIRYRKRPLYHGTIKINFCSKNNLIRILSWINRYCEFVVSNNLIK